MYKGVFYLLTIGFIALILSAPMIIKAAQPKPAACKMQVVEVTKTEGNLTWVDQEEMCL